MRELTSQKIPGKGDGKDTTTVLVLDQPGQGGACHKYVVVAHPVYDAPTDEPCDFIGDPLCSIAFQDGPIQEAGVNGVQQEHLLAIVEDRLACFQAGPYANKYNHAALLHVQAALASLKQRTLDRIERQVEGYNKP